MSVEPCDYDRPAATALTLAIGEFLKTGAAAVLLPVFLSVARYPSRTCAELAKLERVSLSTMSRWLLTLGHIDIGLVQTRTKAGDARYVRHSLTDKGIALVQRMTTRR